MTLTKVTSSPIRAEWRGAKYISVPDGNDVLLAAISRLIRQMQCQQRAFCLQAFTGAI